jgi:hypothetical protein
MFFVCISECIHYPLYLYGLWVLSAVAVLNGFEALSCLSIMGLFEDVLFPLNRSFGTIAFWLIVTMFAFKTTSWKNTFRYRPRFWGFLLSLLLISEIITSKSCFANSLGSSLKYYVLPTLLSAISVGWLAPHWLKLLKKYFI